MCACVHVGVCVNKQRDVYICLSSCFLVPQLHKHTAPEEGIPSGSDRMTSASEEPAVKSVLTLRSCSAQTSDTVASSQAESLWRLGVGSHRWLAEAVTGCVVSCVNNTSWAISRAEHRQRQQLRLPYVVDVVEVKHAALCWCIIHSCSGVIQACCCVLFLMPELLKWNFVALTRSRLLD